MLEIEQKFLLADEAAATALVTRLIELGAVVASPISQADTYYNHPSRDFAQTDEALRVRTVGKQSFITFKGPKLGTVTKTRFELELPLADQTADGWAVILTKLGFVEVATVRKQRTAYQLQCEGRAFEVVIDQVEGLGLYAEVETVVEAAEEAESSERENAEQAVVNLASALGLIKKENSVDAQKEVRHPTGRFAFGVMPKACPPNNRQQCKRNSHSQSCKDNCSSFLWHCF